MNPTYWLFAFLGLSSLLCLGASGSYLFVGRPGMSLAFLCYAIANAGMIWDAFCK